MAMKNIKKTKKWWSMAELGECPKKFISFARGISDYFDLGGKTLQNARNHIKAFDFGKDKLNVKKFGKPPFPNILFYSLGLRRKKAESAYYNAIEILRRGILTPKPYAYIIKKGRFLSDIHILFQNR